jgi:hypothetical protein
MACPGRYRGCYKYFLEKDGGTARKRQLASCWHQIACLPRAPEGVKKFEITGHLLSTGLVFGYGVTAARLRTSFHTVQISRRGIYISFEPLTSTLNDWQVIRRAHRREASCHLLATDTRPDFFLHLDSMLEKKGLNANGEHKGVCCVPSAIHELCVRRSQDKVLGISVTLLVYEQSNCNRHLAGTRILKVKWLHVLKTQELLYYVLFP